MLWQKRVIYETDLRSCERSLTAVDRLHSRRSIGPKSSLGMIPGHTTTWGNTEDKEF